VTPAAFLRFAALVGIVFLWSFGDRQWRTVSLPGAEMLMVVLFGVMMALGLVGLFTRPSAKHDQNTPAISRGLLFAGMFLVMLVSLMGFGGGFLVEYLVRGTTPILRCVLAACWHGLTIWSVGVLAVGERKGK
jgi:hypothetical protein